MRILKFRQRNKNNGHLHFWGWVTGDGWDDQSVDRWVDPMHSDNYENPNKSDQFTGLLDKTGKEIYEGDQVRLSCYGINDPRKIQEVFWNDDRCGFSTRHSGDIPTNQQSIFDADCDWLSDCEVIGNVHQNPELLK